MDPIYCYENENSVVSFNIKTINKSCTNVNKIHKEVAISLLQERSSDRWLRPIKKQDKADDE